MNINVEISREENAKHYNCKIGDVVSIPLEEYIFGVTASEISCKNIEAAKAQAIAARTFSQYFWRKGKTITDKSSVHQAFRASRLTDVYANAKLAAEETAGLVLTYNGEICNRCNYSASNGGRTVSFQERWGSNCPWEIAFDDPWDKAFGQPKSGHGVGMSQNGAKYAASIGKTYKEILAFYYPGTVVMRVGDNGELYSMEQKEGDIMSTKISATSFLEKVKIPLDENWGYIGSTAGEEWTQAKQNSVKTRHFYSENSRQRALQYGSKWIGHRVCDCSGLLYWAVKQLGGSIYHGSDTIYNKYCITKGKLTNGVKIKPGYAVFMYNGTKRNHIGVYIGNGKVEESKGTQYGVVISDLSQWDEWGELNMIDYSMFEFETYTSNKFTALKLGSKGEMVTYVQSALNRIGYSVGVIDGMYGSQTQSAVKKYQADKGITADGICGIITYTKLQEDVKIYDSQFSQNEIYIYNPPSTKEEFDDDDQDLNNVQGEIDTSDVSSSKEEYDDKVVKRYVVTITGLTEDDFNKISSEYTNIIYATY